MTPIQASAIQRIAAAVVESVDPNGTPDGHIYAMLMTQGCTLDQWVQLRDALVACGKIIKRGDLLFAGQS